MVSEHRCKISILIKTKLLFFSHGGFCVFGYCFSRNCLGIFVWIFVLQIIGFVTGCIVLGVLFSKSAGKKRFLTARLTIPMVARVLIFYFV